MLHAFRVRQGCGPSGSARPPLAGGGVVGYSDSLFGSFQDTISLRSPSPRVGLTEVGSSLLTIGLGADLVALCLILVHGAGRQAIWVFVWVLVFVCVLCSVVVLAMVSARSPHTCP